MAGDGTDGVAGFVDRFCTAGEAAAVGCKILNYAFQMELSVLTEFLCFYKSNR